MTHFALANEPLDYQLSVHYRNYRACYGANAFEEHFRMCCRPVVYAFEQRRYCAMLGLVSHYGIDQVTWFLDNVINYKGESWRIS